MQKLHIGFNNPKHIHVYTMLNTDSGERTDIQQVEEEKDLGVTFQDDLKFTKHINNCVNKANRMIGIITHFHRNRQGYVSITLQNNDSSIYGIRYYSLVTSFKKGYLFAGEYTKASNQTS